MFLSTFGAHYLKSVKYIPSSNFDDFISFLSQLTDYQVVKIYNHALSNNYYAIPQFKKICFIWENILMAKYLYNYLYVNILYTFKIYLF